MPWIIIGVFVAWLLFRSKGHASGGAAVLPAAAPDDSGLGYYHAGPSGLDLISQAIYQREGTQPGQISYDNNNPGNLRSAPGQTGSSRGFATFNSFGEGWQALQSYINRNASAHPDWDFYDFFQHYLGQKQGGPTVTNQGDSDAYAEMVAMYAGVDPTSSVLSFLQGAV